MTTPGSLDAGDFASWISATLTSLESGADSDVPCGACNGCCKSSYFIHIRPGESDALAHIPRELLFAAPGLPDGHVVMGYNEHGCCAMLLDERCTIYPHRPETCRVYDCRVFPATGVEPPQLLIAQRAKRWRFTYSSETDRQAQLTLLATGRFLLERADEFPTGWLPTNPAQLAVLAIRVHGVFEAMSDAPDSEVVSAIVAAGSATPGRDEPAARQSASAARSD
jgi:Fe-S-cluster containining protein